MAALALNLFWKEAHELKWRVAAALAVSLVLPLFSLLFDSPNAWYWVQAILFMYPLFAGLFFGGWLAAGERSNRTASFLAALPVSPVWPGLAKLLAATCAILVPLLFLVALSEVARPFSEHFVRDSQQLRLMGGISCVVAIHTLLLTAAFGVGRPSEISAAVWGLGTLALWVFLIALTTSNPSLDWFQNVRWIGPRFDLLQAVANAHHQPTRLPDILQLPWLAASILVLGALFAMRFGRAISPLPHRQRMAWNFSRWLPIHARTTVGALVWKQLQESFPLCGLVLGVSVIFGYQAHASYRGGGQDVFFVVASFGGFVLALLLGVGTFLPDLDQRVNTFWRSRPISAHLWFWTKSCVGLAALLVTIGLHALIASKHGQSLSLVGDEAWIVLGWTGMFAAAVTATCLVRRTTYAAILAIGMIANLIALVYWWHGSFVLTPWELVTKYGEFFVGATIICILAGWQFAVRDLALLE